MIFKECRDCASRLVVLLHPERQSLGAAQHQPRIKRRQDRARAVLNERYPAGIVFVVEYDCTTDSIGMAIQKLRGGVHHDVDAEVERSLQVRRHESVVANNARTRSVCHIRNCLQVSHDHHGVRRRLDENHLRVVFDRGFHVSDVGCVHEFELYPVVRQHSLEQPVGAAIGVVRNDDVVAGFHQAQRRVDRRHTGSECVAKLCPFQGREISLQRQPRRIRRARVLKPLVLSQTVLGIG